MALSSCTCVIPTLWDTQHFTPCFYLTAVHSNLWGVHFKTILSLGLTGWPRLLRYAHSPPSWLAWVWILIQLQTVMLVFHRQGDSPMCVPSLGWTLSWCSVCRHLLVVIKGPTVSFAKSMWAIPGPMEQIPNSCPNNCWERDGKPPSMTLADKLLRQNQRPLTQSMVHRIVLMFYSFVILKM